MRWPSTSVTVGSNALKRASCARQSNVSFQYREQRLEVSELGAHLPVDAGELVRKARAGEALAQVVEHGLRHGDRRWAEVEGHARKVACAADDSRAPRPPNRLATTASTRSFPSTTTARTSSAARSRGRRCAPRRRSRSNPVVPRTRCTPTSCGRAASTCRSRCRSSASATGARTPSRGRSDPGGRGDPRPDRLLPGARARRPLLAAHAGGARPRRPRFRDVSRQRLRPPSDRDADRRGRRTALRRPRLVPRSSSGHGPRKRGSTTTPASRRRTSRTWPTFVPEPASSSRRRWNGVGG